jgi:hypothetical protein
MTLGNPTLSSTIPGHIFVAAISVVSSVARAPRGL